MCSNIGFSYLIILSKFYVLCPGQKILLDYENFFLHCLLAMLTWCLCAALNLLFPVKLKMAKVRAGKGETHLNLDHRKEICNSNEKS